MNGEYATLQHQWFDQVWNRKNEAMIDELLKPDVIGHGLTDADGNEITGIDAFKTFYHSFRSAFPDIHVEIERSVVEGAMSATYCRCTATHAGPGFLIEPTGRRIEFTGICMVRQEDGQIAESWNNFDFLTVMRQLGIC